MSKGIAIRSILLLLIGILVAVGLIYLVYRYATSSQLGMEECRAAIISWCTTCVNAGWIGGPNTPQTVRDCGDTTKGGYTEFSIFLNNGNCGDPNTKTDCGLMGLGG